jgi:type IV pilus assembly protein PilW
MLAAVRRAPRHIRAQRGFSLIELMVGVTIGLIVVIAGVALLAISLRESRQLLLEARLSQELRAASDLIARDLRRAGYWGSANEGVALFGESSIAANPYAPTWPEGAALDVINFQYSQGAENNAVDSKEQFGFRLRAGVLEMHFGGSGWQAMTDIRSFDVTAFSITPTVRRIDLGNFCANPCPPSAINCPPRQEIRSLAVTLEGRLPGVVAVTRNAQSQIRLRNDTIVGACAS